MALDPSSIALLAASGLAAGLVNAVAGGGTFFTFSALVAAGLPPVVANATSAVAVTPGNLSSVYAYKREVIANARHFLPLSLVSLGGGLVGAWILTLTGNAAFRALVPWLLLFATVLFWLSPTIVRFARRIGRAEAETHSPVLKAVGLVIQAVVSAYGGFFGAGMGIVMLAALTITEGDDFHRVNAAKNLCAALIQLIAIVLFILAGLVSWPETAVVAVTALIGGYAGVAFGRRIPPIVMRWLVIGVGTLLTIWFFVTA